jgi:SAM-dependent methyltransferase
MTKKRRAVAPRDVPLALALYGKLEKVLRSGPLLARFAIDVSSYRARSRGNGRFPLEWAYVFPQLHDASPTTGFDRHYTLHTAWAARAIRSLQPAEHYDIGSAIYFSTIVSAFVPVRFFDYRPVPLSLPGLKSERADLRGLPFETDSVASLSCMHVVEHVGLGRYGDPLDPDGDVKAIRELKRVVAPGGNLLFVVPIGGSPRLMFNAHRIYTLQMVLDRFGDEFVLEDFTLIPEDGADGDLVASPSAELLARQKYGCACFRFEKRR